MAEVEFGGLKFSGGKMVALLTALSTLGGAAWGGFEIYKDYMDMKEIIQNIDTDAIAARNDVIETNVKKLEKRYPSGEFDVFLSENRAADDR